MPDNEPDYGSQLHQLSETQLVALIPLVESWATNFLKKQHQLSEAKFVALIPQSEIRTIQLKVVHSKMREWGLHYP